MLTVWQVFLLAGRKRKIGASANYAISMDETDFSKGESYLAKLKCVAPVVCSCYV